MILDSVAVVEPGYGMDERFVDSEDFTQESNVVAFREVASGSD